MAATRCRQVERPRPRPPCRRAALWSTCGAGGSAATETGGRVPGVPVGEGVDCRALPDRRRTSGEGAIGGTLELAKPKKTIAENIFRRVVCGYGASVSNSKRGYSGYENGRGLGGWFWGNTWAKGSRTLACCSGGMPDPESTTSTYTSTHSKRRPAEESARCGADLRLQSASVGQEHQKKHPKPHIFVGVGSQLR